MNMLLAMPNAIYMETSGAQKSMKDGEVAGPEEPGMSSEVPESEIKRYRA